MEKYTKEFYENIKCKYKEHVNDMGANIYICTYISDIVRDFTFSFYPKCDKCKIYKNMLNKKKK